MIPQIYLIHPDGGFELSSKLCVVPTHLLSSCIVLNHAQFSLSDLQLLGVFFLRFPKSRILQRAIFTFRDQLWHDRSRTFSVAMAARAAQVNGQRLLERLHFRQNTSETLIDGKYTQPRSRIIWLRDLDKGANHNRVERCACCADLPPMTQRPKERSDLQEAGAKTLEDARKGLRANMMRQHKHGGRVLKHADFILMWPDRYEPREAFVPSDPRDNRQVQSKRPRCAAWESALEKRKDGTERMMNLTVNNDDTFGINHKDVTSSIPELVLDDDDCDDDFYGSTPFDMDNFGLELRGDIEKARKRHLRRLGDHAVSHSRLCRLVVVLQLSLRQWRLNFDGLGTSKHQKYWRGMVWDAKIGIFKY
jgi:hypothetical protein